MIEENDWRLRGQEEYMKSLQFEFIQFIPKRGSSVHVHCEFCWHKFMECPENVEDCSNQGFCSVDERYWVCKECFKDFKEMFNWTHIVKK